MGDWVCFKKTSFILARFGWDHVLDCSYDDFIETQYFSCFKKDKGCTPVILINMMSRVGTIHNKIWLNHRVLSLWYFLDTPCTGWLNLPTIEKCRVCSQFLFLVSDIMIVSCLSFQIKTATYMTWGTNLVPRLEYHALHIMYYIYWVWNSITLACSPHTTTFLGTFN